MYHIIIYSTCFKNLHKFNVKFLNEFNYILVEECELLSILSTKGWEENKSPVKIE